MTPNYSAEVRKLYERLKKEAVEAGYMLNPDEGFTLGLVQGLHENIRRFGYPACPCRLACGVKAKDIDIECPCYYRDADLEEFGACYCALYVNEDWAQAGRKHKSIPDRRPPEFVTSGYSDAQPAGSLAEPAPSTPGTLESSNPVLSHPVWRCKVCGYLCARDEPPGKCPVCKAAKDRFERFI